MSDEPKLDYRHERWQGHNEEFFVAVSDATLRKHLNAYLESQGICTLTHCQLMEKVKQIEEQQFQVFQRFLHLDYWLTCDDPDVTVQPCTLAAYQQIRGRK